MANVDFRRWVSNRRSRGWAPALKAQRLRPRGPGQRPENPGRCGLGWFHIPSRCSHSGPSRTPISSPTTVGRARPDSNPQEGGDNVTGSSNDPPAGELVSSTPTVEALTVSSGYALDWHTAGWGTFVADSPHAFATREVLSVGGSKELGDLAAPTVWQGMRSTSLAMLSGAALSPGCDGLELRYVAVPQLGAATRIRMFVTAKTRSWYSEPAHTAVEAACAALPSGFTWGLPEVDIGLGRDSPGTPVIELRRHEEVTTPQWDYIPAEYYYTINDDPGDGSGWARFWAVLAKVSRPVEVSILFKATDLDWDEREMLGAVTTDLALVAEPRTDYDVIGNQIFYPADTNAQIALQNWNRRISQLQRPLLARVAVRAELDVGPAVATALAAAIASTSSGDASSHPMYLALPENERDTKQAAHSFNWLEIFPWGGIPLWEHELAPHKLRRLAYLYGLEQAASLAVVPVPDEQGVPGFPRARRVSTRRAAIGAENETGPRVPLGHLIHQGQAAGTASLPLTAINRHVLVVGAPGSGKTTTVLSLLAHLWREHRVPFLVLEPVKTEYRTLLDVRGMDELRVITLGRDDLSPLRLNPLAPPPGVRREVHASAVMAAFKTAMPLMAPLPQLLEESLDRAYENAGWDYDTTMADGVVPPTIRSLLDCFQGVFEKQQYVGDARNIASALSVRLSSLMRGSRGRLLDTVESVDFDDLMSRPVVIEMDEIADDEDKAIISAFLLDRIRASAKARRSTRGELRHVTVLEEAHRLLARAQQGQNAGEGPSARAAAVAAFCEAIAEMRSVGEGFIVSSQSPSALAEAAVANTGTRILHRLESSADRDVMLDDLDASPLERQAAARLRRGEAVTRWPERDEAEIVQVQPASGVDSGNPVNDDTVKQRMAAFSADVRSLLPYALCTREICTQGCDPLRRNEGQRTARDLGPKAGREWQSADGSTRALVPIVNLISTETDGDQPLTYCVASHLEVSGDAFKVKRRVDIKPHLIAAVRASNRRLT